MPSFVIDPLLTTVPDLHVSSAKEVKQWFSALETWLDEMERSPFSWRHMLDCTHLLQTIGRFPSFDSLRNLSAKYKVDVNIRLLHTRLARFFLLPANDILQSTSTIFTIFTGVKIEPMEFLSRNDPSLHEPIVNALMCLACDRQIGERFASRAAMVSPQFEDATVRRVRVHGLVELSEPEHIWFRLLAGVGGGRCPINEHFDAVFLPSDLDRFTEGEDVIEVGEHGLRVLVERVAKREYPAVAMLACTIGDGFWRSFLESTIDTDMSAVKKMLRIAGALVAKRGADLGDAPHEVRTDEAANSPQLRRMRDDARAWRSTIVKHGIGWRLHYWHIPAKLPGQVEMIELDCVLRKKDKVRMLGGDNY